MIKTATFYKAESMPDPEFRVIEALKERAFTPCLPSQESSSGWTAPNGDSLCECLNGQLIMQYTTETKRIPTDVMNRKLDDRCKHREFETGRKPGKKERKSIREDLVFEMLPSVFPVRTSTICWVNPINRMVVVGAGAKRAAEVATALVQALEGLSLTVLSGEQEPSFVMAGWLSGEIYPDSMVIGRSCELQSIDESKAKVKYSNHDLDVDEVRDHIRTGMRPKSLAVTWGDRVSFTLQSDLSIKGISFDDVPDIKEATAFEADAYIATTDLNDMILDLIREFAHEE